MTPIEIIRSATTVGAEVVRQEGKLGVSSPAHSRTCSWSTAIRLKDLGLFQDRGEHLAAIMKGGKFHKNRLS